MHFAGLSLSWGTLVTLVALAILVVTRIRTWLRLRHIPGPPGAGFAKFWLLKKTLGGRFHLDTADACEKYGSIVRIGPNELVSDDPEVLRRVAAVRSPYTRGNWYDGMQLEADFKNVICERGEHRHNELRAKMALGYSGKENDHLEQAIDTNIARFIHLMESKYLSTATEHRPIDMAPTVQFLTLDIISDIAFGKSFGNLEADEDVSGYMKTMEQTLSVIVLLGAFPWLAQVFFSAPMKWMLPKDTETVGMGKLMGIAKQVVGERFGPKKKTKRDMLGSFVEHGLTEREARSESLLQIIAGSDTTATAIRATLLYIITNPRVEAALIEELSNASISSPITDAEARKLPHLQAVIKEGLRIFPPVTGLMCKEVPPGGDTINGLYLPAGTQLGWTPFGVGRNKKVWGEDAAVFRPERWLEANPEQLRKMDQDVDMCFGYGKYQCLGRNVAYMELNKVFVEVLRNFELTLVDPTEPWKSFNAGLFVQSDLWMRVTKRVPSF